MSEKKPVMLAEQLGALVYFDTIKPEKRRDAVPFEKLTEAERIPYIAPAVKFIEYLGKLNISLGAKVDRKKDNLTEEQNLDILADTIEDFIKGVRVVKPGLFPCRELAARILQGPEKK